MNELIKKISVKFEVVEDNGGGLTLFVFGEDGRVIYAHTGYEYIKGQLREDLENLADGDDPTSWDGCLEDMELAYNELQNPIDSCVVADNDGIYPDKFGGAAKYEFE